MPPPETEVVVGNVADGMQHDERDEEQKEGDGLEPPVGRGKQSGDECCLGGNDQDDAARGVQKPCDRSEGGQFGGTGRIKAGESSRPRQPAPGVPVRGNVTCRHGIYPTPVTWPPLPYGRAAARPSRRTSPGRCVVAGGGRKR